MSNPCNPLRIAAVSAIVLGALLVPASGAFASTLASDGSTVTFDADTGAGDQELYLDEQSANDLTIFTSDDPVEYDDTANNDGSNDNSTAVIDNSGADCIDMDGGSPDPNSPASTIVCDNVSRIVANTKNGEDYIDASDVWIGCCTLNTNGLDLIRATVHGGTGSDTVYSGDDPDGDLLSGEDGDDYIEGQDGADDIRGGANEDTLYGQGGDDLLRAGDESDFLDGGDGDDDSDGEAGNDVTNEYDDSDVDKSRGGSGIDELNYFGCDNGCSNDDDVDINEDGQEDDGDTEDDPDNDFDGFENVEVNTNDNAIARVLTTSGNDAITGNDQVDVVTPRDGVDRADLGDNDDTANTVDGYPDVVNCGNGDDTANADQFDELNDCEDVNITEVESAFDQNPNDAPPTVAFTNLNPNAFLPPIGTHLEAAASDDNGVALVVFFDDTERLCDDTTAPYTCEWQQTSEDVGENVLTAFAVDTAGQIGADIQSVFVGKFNPDDLEARATKRDLNGPRRTRVRGMLDLPTGVSTEEGCEGDVRVRILDGSDLLRKRRVPVQEDCEYSHSFRLPGVRKIDNERVKIKTKFLGNEVLQKEKGNVVKTKVQDL